MNTLSIRMSSMFPNIPAAIIVNGVKISRLPIGFANAMKAFPYVLASAESLCEHCDDVAIATSKTGHKSICNAWNSLHTDIVNALNK